MQYVIRGLTASNKITSLNIDAIDEEAASSAARDQGIFVTSISPQQAGLRVTISRKEHGTPLSLLLFSQELLALLKAGLSIVECLEALLEKETNVQARRVLERLLCGLRDGNRLSSAMAEEGALFPPLYVSIVRTSEGTSDLPRALTRYIDYQVRSDLVRRKLVSASIYPMILLSVGGMVAVFLIGFVVPQFALVYQGTGKNLSGVSQLMLNWGLFVQAHTPLLTAGFIMLVGASVYFGRLFLKSGGLLRAALRVPGLGEKIRIFELARLYMTLGMLLEGGIPVMQSLETAKGVTSAALVKSVDAAAAAVNSGQSLAASFESASLITPISLRMLRVGERSGNLGGMLTQSAAFYEEEINRWIDQFARVVEPVLMAAIGLLVGGVVVVLYMPIFDLAGSL